ncbi:cytochrome c oxidase assembly protein [Naasia sp. SYSU D00948]|uniref:cytochrome c oxidase assembly protein n=1 Tax=Naasia sp. SYSU D00948 TaxID=2817379 RepID=UPI001B30D925|nr:cytochrome c oxidase assembly protein [Naasia sp. SYSU D00948]
MPSGPLDAPAARLLGTGGLVAASLLALFVALAFGGGAAALLVDDPGPIVRIGLPLGKLIVDLAVSVTLGALALVALVLGGSREIGRALDIAAAAAGVWTVAAAVTGLLTFLSVTGLPLSFDETFGAQLGFFLTSVDTGEAWLVTTLLAAALTVLCFAVRSRPALLLVLALAVAAVLPLAGEGHSAGAGTHEEAVAALALHLVFVAVWLGGLLTILLLRRTLGTTLAEVVARYSALALLCFCVVAVSGYVSAELRIGALDRLATPYGLLVVAKVLALLALGAIGAVHRRWIVRRAQGGAARWFWMLVVAELAVMGVATGTAAALARTSPPVDDEAAVPDDSPAAVLTGQALPPPLDPAQLLVQARLELVWLVAAGVAAAYYLAGVVRLARRGERWPVARTASWLAGVLVLVAVTSGGVGVYARHLFSAQMGAGAALGVLIPVLLVAAAPFGLLAEAAVPRSDGSRGVREWVELARGTRWVRSLAHPLVVAVVAVLSPWLLLYSPAFRWFVTDAAGRQTVVAVLLVTGVLVVGAALHRGRAAALGAVAGALSWAAVGVLLLVGDTLLLVDWYGAMGWPGPAIEDQRRGGAVLLVAAALPLAIVGAVGLRRRREAPPRPAGSPESRYRSMLERAGRSG